MPSFSAKNQHEFEQLVYPERVTRLQLSAGPPIDITEGTYSERDIVIPDEYGERGGRKAKIEMFRAVTPDGQVVIGKTESILGMWMTFSE